MEQGQAHTARLLALKVKEYWGLFWHEPLSFRLACAYIFFEYYRPQSIYKSLAVIPWSTICLFGGLLALVVEGGPRSRARSRVSSLLLLFAGIVFLSSTTAWRPELSWRMWDQFWLWVPVYYLVIGTVTSFRRFALFMALWALWSTKMALSGFLAWARAGFQFLDWGVYGSPGWFQNSGDLGIQMIIFFSVLIMALSAMWPRLSYFKRLIGTVVLTAAVLTIVASSSRGAMGGLAVSVSWVVLQSRYKSRALLGVLILGAVLLFIIPQGFKERFATTGVDVTSIQRAKYRERGMQIMGEYPALGIGYFNWQEYYRSRYQEFGHMPHNIYVQAGAELGYTGLVAFLLLALGGFLSNRGTRTAASALASAGAEHALFLRNLSIGLDSGQLGFLSAGYFVSVLYYPFFWIGLALSVALNHITTQEANALSTASTRRMPTSSRLDGTGPTLRMSSGHRVRLPRRG